MAIEDRVENKAYFIQRMIAFIIDIVIISFLATLISVPFIDQDKMTKLENQTIELVEDLRDQEIQAEEYISRYVSLYYKMARTRGIETLATIFLSVCYFVVYQVHFGGQTLGKKLMKIRVVSEDGELSYNQMIFRSFVANSILLNILTFIFMMMGENQKYFYMVSIFEIIQITITLISVFMIMNRKNGLAIHDRIAHTKVLREN